VKGSISSSQTRKTELIQAAPLRRYGWLVHAFTTRHQSAGRDFNLSYSVAKDPNDVSRNRRRLMRRLTTKGMQLITLRQRHTDMIQVIDSLPHVGEHEPDGALKFPGDAVVSTRPGLLLAVQVADCLPLLLVDAKRRVVAAVHAGWRGTVKRIAEKTVGRMRQEFGTNPKDVRAAFGPSIRRCCYEVGREVVEAYQGTFSYCDELFSRTEPSPSEVHWQQPLLTDNRKLRPRPGVTAPPGEKFHLDLVAANRRQLQAAGVPARNIWTSPLCTACHTDLLFSHRAEHGRTGRLMGLIGLREP
jgi:hypothetical protein